MYKSILSLLSVVACAASPVFATSYGTNITIPDLNNNGSNPSDPGAWYSDREDNETETNPDTVNSQDWDLEGMYLNGSTLTIVGGYDFKNGYNYGGYTYRPGDLFIAHNTTPVYGQAANGGSGVTNWGSPQPLVTTNDFGYNLALAFGPSVGDEISFNVFSLTDSSKVDRGMDVAASNPWRYDSDGDLIGSGIADYGILSDADAAALGLLGWNGNDTHYFLTIDLSSIPGITGDDYFHYTMECGNDDLMAHANVPDSSTTAMLLGLALVGIAGFRRKLAA